MQNAAVYEPITIKEIVIIMISKIIGPNYITKECGQNILVVVVYDAIYNVNCLLGAWAALASCLSTKKRAKKRAKNFYICSKRE